MQRPHDLLRQTVVGVSAVLAVAGSFVGSGAAGGTPIQEASGGALAADATPVAPGGPAFGIWSIIYLGLILYAIWQFLPAQKTDPRQRRLGYPVAASLVLNAAWILSVQFDLLALSVPVIVLLLADLVWAFLIIVATRPRGRVETVVVDGTIGLYLGWVCVATAANVTAALTVAGFDGFGIDPGAWAVAVIAVAGLVGVLLAVAGHGRLSPAASLCWGLAWVAVARLTGELISVPAAIAAIVAVAVVAVVTVSLRVRATRPGGGVADKVPSWARGRYFVRRSRARTRGTLRPLVGVEVGFEERNERVERLLGALALCPQNHDVTVGCSEAHQRQDARGVHGVFGGVLLQGDGDLDGQRANSLREDSGGPGVQPDAAGDDGFTFVHGVSSWVCGCRWCGC